MKKVLVISTIDGLAGRNGLTGIFRVANSALDWSIRFIDHPAEDEAGLRKTIAEDGIDGIIVALDRESDLLPYILETELPVVMIHDKTNFARGAAAGGGGTPPLPRQNFVLLKNDDLAIGRMGARHLLDCGRFASFAYVRTESRTSWSVFRERGYRLELAGEGIVPQRWRSGRVSLADFLLSLPRPIALMAATDVDAMRVVDACHSAHLPIPACVAIVSVDNDEIICESTKPMLSSIRTDDVFLGELAARALDEMMRTRTPSAAREILVRPTEVVERCSTRSVPPAGHLVHEALRYIRNNVSHGVTANDVVCHLKVSPALSRIRFSSVMGKSIRDTILDMRLALAEKRLLTTSEPIARIAKSCGFSSACRFTHFFQERHGCSPTEFRNCGGAYPPAKPPRSGR